MLKKLWHDTTEEPVIGDAEYVRIACITESRIDRKTSSIGIDSIRIYQPDQWTVPWSITVLENHIIAWAYFDELISNKACLRSE